MSFELLRPLWLLALVPWLALLVMPWLGWGGAGAELSQGRARLATLARGLGLLCLILALAGLRQALPGDQLTVMFLVDRSHSVDHAEGFLDDYLEKALKGRNPRDLAGIINFAGEAALEVPAARLDRPTRATAVLDANATDLAAAIRFATATIPAGSAGRLILLSDGNETRGRSLEEARLAARMGLEVWTVPVPDRPGLEVMVDSVRVPGHPTADSPFEVSVVVSSNQACRAELTIRRDGHPIASEPVDLRPGRNLFMLSQPPQKGGIYRYTAQINAPQDGEAANNRADGVAQIQARPRLLYVTSTGIAPGPVAARLQAMGFAVEPATPASLPGDLARWQAYNLVVLDDVSAYDLGTQQQAWLATLVRETGLGLAMLGGARSFGAGGYYQTPVGEVLPIDMRIRRRKDTPVSAEIMVLDKSGSMSDSEGGVERIQLAREAAIAALAMLNEQDYVGVIGFDSAYKWVVKLQTASDRKRLAALIATLRPGGGTNLYPALQAAIQALEAQRSAVKHLLVLSDGQVEPADFKHLTARARQAHITISTVAVGSGADRAFLHDLAVQGEGRAYQADSASTLPMIFTRETLLSSRKAFREEPVSVVPVAVHPVTAGIDLGGLPRLLGCNLVSPAPPPAQTILQTPEGDPVLALGRYGLGKTLAFTGDDGRRWSRAFLESAAGGQLLAQAIRSLTPDSERAEFSVFLESAGDGRIRVALQTNESAPGLLEASLLSPQGQVQPLLLQPTGPGRFEAEFSPDQPGSYLVAVRDQEGGSLTRVYSQPYSPEHAAVGTRSDLLRQLAEAGQGRFQSDPREVFLPPQNPPQRFQELWPQLVLCALWLLVVDVALRRLMLPEGWLKRLGRLRPRPAGPAPGEVTTSRLLERKKATPTPSRVPPPVTPPTSSSPPAPPPPPAAPAKSAPSTGASGLDRLKQAKRRALRPEDKSDQN